MKGSSFFGKILFPLNIVVAGFLFFACVATYISVEHLPILFALGLAAPLLVFFNILFVVYWALRRKGQILLSLSVLLIGYFLQDSFVRIFNAQTTVPKEDISILTYNTLKFGGEARRKNPEIANNIVDFVADQDPDIICFQEFDYGQIRKHNFADYPYHYVNREQSFHDGVVLQAIYSKYPIVHSGSVDFGDSKNNAIFSDIRIDKDTIRVYNLHLQSLNVRPGSFKREEPKRLLKRLGNIFVKQQQQARLIKAHASETGLRKIISGDFNNTQFSNVYRVMKGDMQDTFQEKGFGYGRTYNFKFLPFRIDFILMDESFEITAHRNFDVQYSDHYPVMASFRLKP